MLQWPLDSYSVVNVLLVSSKLSFLPSFACQRNSVQRDDKNLHDCIISAGYKITFQQPSLSFLDLHEKSNQNTAYFLCKICLVENNLAAKKPRIFHIILNSQLNFCTDLFNYIVQYINRGPNSFIKTVKLCTQLTCKRNWIDPILTTFVSFNVKVLDIKVLSVLTLIRKGNPPCCPLQAISY